MTRTDARSRPDTPPRPRIWAEGQQRPRFDLSAFGRVTLAMASRALVPEIQDAAQRLGLLGPAVACGQRRLTPRRFAKQDARMGRAILAVATLFQGAHDLLIPAQPDLTLAYPDIIRSPQPSTSTGPSTKAGPITTTTLPAPARTDEPTLQAIRSAMFFGHPDPIPQTAAITAPAPPLAGNNPLRSALWALACRAVLVVLLAFALPMAALRAGWFHLQGGDLADWS